MQINPDNFNKPEMRDKLMAEAIRRGLILPENFGKAMKWQNYEDLHKWLQETSPHFTWDWPFSIFVQQILAELTPDSGRKIVFEIPIRHGKSELITKHYPVALIHADPRTKVGLGCHTADLAAKFGRSMLKMAKKRGVPLARETSADWETDAGGGFHGAGVGGAMAGYGFHHISFDDPLKNRKEAESRIQRDAVWEWLHDDLLTRKESPGTNICGVMSRWHEDDPVGRIKESEDADTWELYFLPALCMDDQDLLGREIGEALCPQRFDEEYLLREKRRMGSYAFSGLYQQEPVPREGAMFNVGRIEQLDAQEVWETVWPVAAAMPTLPSAIGTDLGASVHGDETVMVCMSGPDIDGKFYITDMIHGDWEPDRRNREMDEFLEMWPVMGQQAPTVLIPQDPGQAGKSQAQSFVKRWNNRSCRIVYPSGSKELRADAFASACNAGLVVCARQGWTRFAMDQLRSFPLGVHDDIVDACADAYNFLTGRISGKMMKRRKGRAL